MGGKGTVITNTGTQSTSYVRIVEKPTGAPDACKPGVLFNFTGTGIAGETYTLAYTTKDDVSTYSISGTGSTSSGTVASDGKKVGTHTIYKVSSRYTKSAGTTPTYTAHTLSTGLGATAKFALIYKDDGTVYGADFVGATLPGSDF